MPKLDELLASELQRRLETLSTEELITVMGVRMRRAKRSSVPPPSSSRRISTPRLRAIGTVWDAVASALRDWNNRGRYPNSTELVAAVRMARPDTEEPTIRAEISRRKHAGAIAIDSAGRFRMAS